MLQNRRLYRLNEEINDVSQRIQSRLEAHIGSVALSPVSAS